MNHLPFSTGGALQVRRVFCVGRNYVEHAKEMGHDGREPPFFFAKSAEALHMGPDIPYPPMTEDLHHEVELVVAIGRDGAAISAQAARSHIAGYAVGIDLTRRDLQAIAKKQARPWALAKSWLGAAPIGALHTPEEVGHPRSGRINLKVDGEVRQTGDLREMIWSVDEIIAELSRYDRLLAGDLIMTGTPAGVGPLVIGNRVEVAIEGIGQAGFVIQPPGAMA